MPYSLPPLSYAYDALEPHIDAQTMEIHYLPSSNRISSSMTQVMALAPRWATIHASPCG